MAEPFAHFQLEGLEKVQRTLNRVEALGGDLGGLLGAVGDAARGVVIKRFDAERGLGGVPWPKSKRALGLVPNARGKKTPGLTLTDTGDLRNSLAVEVRGNEVEVGFRGLRSPEKAKANQFGTSGKSTVRAHTRVIKSAFGIPFPEGKSVNVRSYGRINNIPPRPMLGFDAEMTDTITETARLFLLDILVRK